MKDAEQIYTDLWSKALHLFEAGQYETDPLINDPADLRRGLTLRAMLDPEIASEIKKYTEAIKTFIPSQYFTPISELHLTVLTVVSCNSDICHKPETDDLYCEVIQECIRDLPPPRIALRGITASPSCLLLRGYPENDCLEELRNRLRGRFKESTLPSSVDFRYSLKTAHVTIMRFTDPQRDIAEFTHFIKETQNRPFGNQTIDQVELVANDWCHKKENTRLVRTFSLSN